MGHIEELRRIGQLVADGIFKSARVTVELEIQYDDEVNDTDPEVMRGHARDRVIMTLIDGRDVNAAVVRTGLRAGNWDLASFDGDVRDIVELLIDYHGGNEDDAEEFLASRDDYSTVVPGPFADVHFDLEGDAVCGTLNYESGTTTVANVTCVDCNNRLADEQQWLDIEDARRTDEEAYGPNPR